MLRCVTATGEQYLYGLKVWNTIEQERAGISEGMGGGERAQRADAIHLFILPKNLTFTPKVTQHNNPSAWRVTPNE